MNADPYAVILAQLESQRAEIETAIKAIKQTRARFGTPSASTGLSQIAPAAINGTGVIVPINAFEDMTVPEAILKYFEIRGESKMTAPQIADGLKMGEHKSSVGPNFSTVLLSALRRMQERGILARDDDYWVKKQ